MPGAGAGGSAESAGGQLAGRLPRLLSSLAGYGPMRGDV